MNTITMSAVIVTLFLGGPDGPGFSFARWLWPILWFLGKTFLFLFGYVWLRAALPRLRYDQLMNLGWRYLIPISLGWLLVVAGFQISLAVGAATFGAAVLVALVLPRAFAVGKARHEESGGHDFDRVGG